MIKKVKGNRKNVCIGFIISFFIFTFNIGSLKTAKANESNVYFWSIEKSVKSFIFQEEININKNKKLEELLEIESIEPYFEDMNLLYQLSLSKNKVKEVEKIISDCEKQLISYELYLLTGDKVLSNEYLANDDLYFNFEMVIQ